MVIVNESPYLATLEVAENSINQLLEACWYVILKKVNKIKGIRNMKYQNTSG